MRALYSIVQVISEEVKLCWIQYWPMEYTTIAFSSMRLFSTGHKFLGLVIQLAFILAPYLNAYLYKQYYIIFFMMISWESQRLF